MRAKEARPVHELGADPDEDTSTSTEAAANRDEETMCDLGEGLRDVALALAEPVTQTDSVATSVPTPNDVGHGFDLDAG